MPSTLLISGPSGVGKTTLLVELLARLNERRARGFLSPVIIEEEVRQGWQLLPIGDMPSVLAHRDLSSDHRMGPYGVDLPLFERVSATEMAFPSDADVYLIDEVGIISARSAAFRARMEALIDSPIPVIAIVRASGSGFHRSLWERPDVDRLHIATRGKATVQHLLDWLRDQPHHP